MSELAPPTNGHGALVPLRAAADNATAEAWGFVLDALGIVNQVDLIDGRFVLWVAEPERARAEAALRAQDAEARERAVAVVPAPLDQGRSAAGVAMVIVLAAFYYVAGSREAGDLGGWFARGASSAEAIVRHGQWYRAFTALTLHADALHILTNSIATLIFVTALGRWLGGGLALLLTLLAGGLGNLAVAYSYGSGHNSVGASTATFGALGLLGGLQIVRWLRGRRVQGARRRAITVVAACLGIFAMLGAGDRSDVYGNLQIDVRAHLLGLGAGLALGAAVGVLTRRPLGWLAQIASGSLAGLLLATVWRLAWR
jgi:rhomboid protease GluP